MARDEAGVSASWEPNASARPAAPKFYDLGKRPVCPRCGAKAELKRANAEAGERPRRRGKPPPAAAAAAVARRRRREWSPEQAAALDKVGRWLQSGEPQVFRLFGYAGVGKTTLARHVAEGARGEAVFAAFTGKAALVLRSKGCAGASTIHSLIYRASEDEDGAPTFTLNHDGPASRAGLIVIDECSMVDEELARDLLSFGKPILVLGDPAQLPPVKGGGFFTEGEPDVMLTEIHRQAEDNPIIRLSQIVRAGGEIGTASMARPGSSGATRSTRPQVLGADQVLVGLNRTRRPTISASASCNGSTEPLPVAGDKLVCLRNDRTKGLINGGLWRVEALGGMRKDFVKHDGALGGRRRAARSVKVAVQKAFFEGREADLPIRCGASPTNSTTATR